MPNRTLSKHISLFFCVTLCSVALVAADEAEGEMIGRPTLPTAAVATVTNTITGVKALHLNKSGVKNTANGYKAMYWNKSGDHNIAVGYQAGLNVTGNNNSLV